MTENETRRQLVDFGRSLFERGFAAGGAGNLSARLENGCFLVTPTNSCLGRLSEDRLSLLDANGKLLEGDMPSKEQFLHAGVYAVRNDCGAVVHLHSTCLTALSCLKGLNAQDAIEPFTPYYVMRIGALPVIPYYRPGDVAMVPEIQRCLKNGTAVLMANHGVTVIGKNLVEAVNNAEELEETAKLFFLLKGCQVNYLAGEQVAELRS
jgi:Ribulose-5-phosphate 4-epimerase and related epimerases and aldolases